MGLLDHFGSQHEQIESSQHEGSLTHEVIAGAASYQAVKAYTEHCAKNGKPVDHATGKALMVGFATAIADKLIETKGLDYLDKQKAKRHAEEQVEKFYDDEHEH